MLGCLHGFPRTTQLQHTRPLGDSSSEINVHRHFGLVDLEFLSPQGQDGKWDQELKNPSTSTLTRLLSDSGQELDAHGGMANSFVKLEIVVHLSMDLESNAKESLVNHLLH